MNARGRSLLTVRAFMLACAAFAWLPAYAVCPQGTPAGITNCIFVNNIPATVDLSCGGARSTTGCQAGEFVVAPQVTSNTILSCNNGDTITIDIVIGLYGGNANRYNIGAFFGQAANDPAASTAPPAAKCSVATFPNTPLPWFEDTTNPNTCGDYGTNPDPNTNETFNDVTGIKVLCVGDPVTHKLIVPYLITYDQNNSACTGPSDVTNGSPSKCNKGSLTVGSVTVVPNADLSMVKTQSYDTQNNKINYTLTISNAGPDPADGATYTDTLLPILTNVTASCNNADATGGADCGTGPTVGVYDPIAGTAVSGTVGLLPVGGTVVIKISGDVAPGQQISVDNTACTAPPVGTVDTNGVNNCDTVNTQLPVTLQNFDVK